MTIIVDEYIRLTIAHIFVVCFLFCPSEISDGFYQAEVAW